MNSMRSWWLNLFFFLSLLPRTVLPARPHIVILPIFFEFFEIVIDFSELSDILPAQSNAL